MKNEECRFENYGLFNFILQKTSYLCILETSITLYKNMAGLYVHIPFCASRCIYCGFYSTTLASLKDAYVEALCMEMERRAGGERAGIQTIYLGGGTPSQLSPKQLQRLFHYIYKIHDVDGQAEVTMECNPDDLTPEYVALLGTLPVNRVSMGTQTFSDERLRFLHRRHTARQVGEAVGLLRKAGIGNISIDLMFGFPGETLEEWRQDIGQALALRVEHISAYSLMYEEGTPLEALSRNDPRYAPIGEELSLEMYETLIDRLTAAGYEHYEISNFAFRPQGGKAFRSRHNSSYWQGIPYIGIGAAAHSYDTDSRWWNIADMQAYIRRMKAGECVVEERETLQEDTRYNDMVTTAMRTCEGLPLALLDERQRQYLMRQAGPHLARGLVELADNHLRLTRQGLFVSDAIMSDFMRV